MNQQLKTRPTGGGVLAGGILALIGMVVLASEEPIITTNRVMAAPHFREVDGQLYNIYRSVKWKYIQGPFDILESPFPDLVLIQTFSVRLQKHLTDEMVVLPRRAGNSGRVIGQTVSHGWDMQEEEIPRERLLVRNFTNAQTITVPNTIRGTNGSFEFARLRTNVAMVAMQVAITNYGGDTIAIVDCGTPHYVSVLTTNRIEAPKP
jgi:hypothetical protein